MKFTRFIKSVSLDIWSGLKEALIGVGSIVIAMAVVFGILSLIGWVLSFFISLPVTSSPVFMTLVAFGMIGLVALFFIGSILYWSYRLARWLVNSWKNA